MNSYTKAASGLYINYFLLGMVNIILSSNMASLSDQWDTDKAGISYIISAIGIGKLLTYALSGHLSDRFGRKPLVIFAAIAMGIFLVGIPLSPIYQVAFMFALLAGVANSAMDAGSYPGLIEIFPRSSGSASVMVKAFISLGAALLPFMILFFTNQGVSYSYAFFVPAAIFFLNMLFLMTVTFPDHRAIVEGEAAERAGKSKFLSEPKFSREGSALVIIGFTSTGLFTVAQIWLPSYGEEVLGMAADSSVKLLSYYSIGALVSVLSLSILLKKVIRPVTVIVLYPIITFIAITIILTVKIPAVAVATAFFIGFSTAGIFQLAITIMTELFWQKKGTVTGIVATAGGLAAIVMPLLTGLLSETGNIAIIFIFDAFLAVIGFVSAAFVYYRYEKIVIKPKDTEAEQRALS